MIIRLFLAASIALACWWLLQEGPRTQRMFVRRAAGILVAVLAVVCIVDPQLVTDVAHAVGVSAAPNLLLYLLIVVFTLTTMLQGRRIRELETRFAKLVRADALARGPHVDGLGGDSGEEDGKRETAA